MDVSILIQPTFNQHNLRPRYPRHGQSIQRSSDPAIQRSKNGHSTVPTSSSTILFRLKDPHNGATGVGTRQRAVGNTRVATPGSEHGRCIKQGRRPENRARNMDSKSFALACAFLRPPVWPSVSCVGGSVFRCGFVVPVCVSARVAGWFLLCGSFLPFVSRAPTQKPSTLEGNPQVRKRLRSTRLLTLVETLGCLLYCAQYNSSQLSRLRPFSLLRIVLSTGLLGNGNDTTACGHPFSQFLLHVASSRPILD